MGWVGVGLIRVVMKVREEGVKLEGVVDVWWNEWVIKRFVGKVVVIVVWGVVREEEGWFEVVVDRSVVG